MYTTPVNIAAYPLRVNHAMSGLILGSCFAQEIGAKMAVAKFPIVLNPAGVLFNPASVGKVYNDIITERQYSESDLVFHGGMWHSMNHHGSFSGTDSKSVLERLNQPQPVRYDYIIVTLGTAWIYEYKAEVVANCHKLPCAEFCRRRLTVDDTMQSLEPIVRSGAEVILTVSPVRHLKDGLSENSLSKSILRVAAGILTEQYANVHYFPSYEIVTDELRDYRYYADDMLHPSKVAVEYIWKRFSDSFFTTETRKLVREIEKVTAELAHRPLHGQTTEYSKFRENTLLKIAAIKAAHPEIEI